MQILINFILSLFLLLHGIIGFAANMPWKLQSGYLNLNWLDKKYTPTENFYQYSNGTWQKKNPVPPAYSNWGTFDILRHKNQQRIHDLVKKTARKNNAPDSIQQKVGDFYKSGMDLKTINSLGAKPLQSEFDRIQAITNLSDLQNTITHLHSIGVDGFFGFDQMQDFKDSTQVIGVAYQGGLSLPDRDYYLKDEPRFKKLRDAYHDHIIKMFQLLGDDEKKATDEANIVMAIETQLAKASMPRIEQRNPQAVYHPMTVAEFQKLVPDFSWTAYFTDLGHPEIKAINVAMPDFFKALNNQLSSVPLDQWKIYLRWHLINSFSSYLSDPFVNENFRVSSLFTGAKELLPRWQRVINAENGALGFAIGKLYVEKYFPSTSKREVLDLLHSIRSALREDLQSLDWMTPTTRTEALQKLSQMGERIGYPEKWRDYSNLHISKGPYVLNIIRTNEFLVKRELNKIGKPVDKNEWDMTPQTINAYYDASMNNLNVPAGILQPPFFDPKAPAAVNYGSIGFVMGHEMTHGFDDSGAQFDGKGNLNNWWTPEDLKRFKAATECIADQFSKYTVDDGIHLQGKLVVGEATADLGGLTLAYRAFHASDAYKKAKTIRGFTPDQQFFLGAAHVWANNIRPEQLRQMVVVDPHPPAIYRVNGTIANMPAFQKAFNIPDTSAMVNKNRCVIW